MRKAINLKKLLCFLASGLLIFVLLFAAVACGTDDPDDETDGDDDGGSTTSSVTIKLWTPITGSDLTTFEKLIYKFEQEYPNITISHTSAVRETHYNNLKLNIGESSGPDLAIIHSQLVQNYAANGYLVPIDSSFYADGEEEIDPDDYLTNVISTLYYDNELYGVPFDVHPIVLYYNKSIVGDNELPTTYAELMALAQKLTTSDVYGLPISNLWPSEFVYTTALYQNGGEDITSDSEPLFNSESGATAAEVLRDIIHKYEVSPNNLSTDQDYNLFTSGKAAFHIQGSWMLNSLVDALGDDLGVMSLSGLLSVTDCDSSNDVMARSHCFCVCTTKKSMSSAKKQAIITFIKWMGEHSDEWSEAGQIPAYNAARETETYLNAAYIHDFGDPDNFRTATGAVYYESGYETVFEYVTKIMKENTSDDDIYDILATAEAEAKRAVASEKS